MDIGATQKAYRVRVEEQIRALLASSFQRFLIYTPEKLTWTVFLYKPVVFRVYVSFQWGTFPLDIGMVGRQGILSILDAVHVASSFFTA